MPPPPREPDGGELRPRGNGGGAGPALTEGAQAIVDTKDGRSGTPEPPRPISARVTRAPSSLGPEAATPLSQWDRRATAPPVTHTEHSGPDGPPAVLTRRPHAAGGTPGSGGLSDAMLPAAPGPPPSSDSVLPFQGHGWASHCLLDTTPGCPPSTHTTVLTPRGSGSVSSSRYPTPSGREHVFPGSRGSAGQRPRGPGGEPRGAGGSHWQAPGPSAVRAQGPAEARLHGDLGPVTITLRRLAVTAVTA